MCPVHRDMLCTLHDHSCSEPLCAGICDCGLPARQKEHAENLEALDHVLGIMRENLAGMTNAANILKYETAIRVVRGYRDTLTSLITYT